MIKKLLLSLCFLLTGWISAHAQYPLVTISQIQAPVSIPGCNDSSVLYKDTVKVRGVVMMNGGLAQAGSGRNVWIRTGSGVNNGIDVFAAVTGSPTTPDDMLSLLAGDSVELVGWVDEFSGESEIRPLTSGGVTVLGSGTVGAPTPVTIAELNNSARLNLITSGEKYEGQYVEITGCVVTSVDYFSGGTRVSFNVRDAAGNIMNVSDRFLIQRLPPTGTFVPPVVGDSFCYLRGVLMHSRSNDPVIPCSAFSPTGRGYELHPFDASHYSICSAAPSIFNVTRTPITPTSSQTCLVSADITDANGISSATLYYAVGIGTITYTSVPMTKGAGTNWSGIIPAQADGSFVKYYVCATDSASNTACNKSVPTGAYPFWYWVHDTGTEIYDVQYIPSAATSGNSGYEGLDVTVTGVVTASAEPNNLGYVYIQQEGKTTWAGLMLVNDASLSTVTVGQKVSVTGTIQENFGFTRMDVSGLTVLGTATIAPLTLSPTVFTTYDLTTNEPYESMLIKIKNPAGQLTVVDQNADGPPSNFAEYRVGNDPFDPAAGCRILAGRQTSSAFSSLNVSYVNDSSWATTDGIISPSIPLCIVYDGQKFDSIVGIVHYAFSNMKLTPRNNGDYFGDPCILNQESAILNGTVRVFPNPASTLLNVELDLVNDFRGTVTMYDLVGREIKSVSIAGSQAKVSLDVMQVPAGAYIVSVNDQKGERVHHSKVIITR